MLLTKIISIACTTLFGLFGSFLIFGQPGKHTGNILLGIFFLLFAANFIDGWLLLEGFYLHHPAWALWEDPFALLYGPLIYFYTRSVIGRLHWNWKHCLHGIPFFGGLLIVIFGYQMLSPSEQLNRLSSIISLQQPRQLLIPVMLIFSQIFGYILASLSILKSYQQELSKLFSSKAKIQWVDRMIRSLFMVLALSLFTSFVQYFGGQMQFELALTVLTLALLVFIVLVFVRALHQPKLFLKEARMDSKLPAVGDDLDALAVKIKVAMESDKVFLNPDLTLEDFANHLQEPARSVSAVINHKYQSNFFDFVNHYRIEEAKRILRASQDSKLTVLEVMYKCGFNSKSSFNTQFSRRTGVTPTAFRKSITKPVG